MKAVFRIFNECFNSGEWVVEVNVPEYFLNNIHLHDIISSQLLMSFPEFDSHHFMNALKEVDMIDFRNKVLTLIEKQGYPQTKAVVEVWYDWMCDFNLTVTTRKWLNKPHNDQFYLEIWLKDN